MSSAARATRDEGTIDVLILLSGAGALALVLIPVVFVSQMATKRAVTP